MKYKVSPCISVPCFLTAFLVALAGHTTGEEAPASCVAPKILRFHILTGSNSAQDQALKLGLRGLALDYVRSQVPDSSDKEELITRLRNNKTSIETMSEEWLSDQGSDRLVALEVTQDYSPAKAYGDMVFPRGTYDVVRVTVGSGKGYNWWCVLYPSPCYTDSTRAVVSDPSEQTLICLLDENDYRSLLAQKDRDGKKLEVRARLRFLDSLQ